MLAQTATLVAMGCMPPKSVSDKATTPVATSSKSTLPLQKQHMKIK